MPKLLLTATLTLITLLALTAAFNQSARPNLASPLPPPHFGTSILSSAGPRPLHPLGLLRLAALSRRG